MNERRHGAGEKSGGRGGQGGETGKKERFAGKRLDNGSPLGKASEKGTASLFVIGRLRSRKGKSRGSKKELRDGRGGPERELGKPEKG